MEFKDYAQWSLIFLDVSGIGWSDYKEYLNGLLFCLMFLVIVGLTINFLLISLLFRSMFLVLVGPNKILSKY